MADDYDPDSLNQRFNERRDKLRSFVRDLDASIDYFGRTPTTENEELQQKQGMKDDLYKLENRMAEFRGELQ